MVRRTRAAPDAVPASPPSNPWMRFWRFLQPPVFADDEKTRAAHTLHLLLLSCFGAGGLSLAASLTVYSAKVAGFSLTLAFSIPLVIAYILLRQGRVKAASRVTVASAWCISTFVVSLAGGMSGAAVVLYLVCTTLAGLLLGSRAALRTAAASALAGLALVALPVAGYPLPRFLPTPPLSSWIIMVVGLYLITVALHVTLSNLRQALEAARRQLAERHKAEAALRESELQFGDIARNLPGMVFQYRRSLIDGTGRFSYASPRARELFGLPVDAPGQDFSLAQNMHPDDALAFDAAVQRAESLRTDWSFEGRLMVPSGGYKWIQGIASPTVAGDELVFNGLLLDITERKRVEAEIQRLRQFNEDILQNVAEGIVVQDTKGVFVFANPAACELMGRPLTELIGLPGYSVIPPDQRPLVDAADQRRAAGQTDRYELEVCRKDGTRVPILVSGRPRLENGHFAGSLAVFTDMRERKRAEAELRRLNAELEQRVTARTAELSARTAELSARSNELNLANAALARAARLKDEFLAGMSHELRTPLTAIMGLAEALQISPVDPPSESQFHALQTIRDSGEHLLALITDILDLSKVEAGKMELGLGPLLVDDLCQTSLQMVRQTALKKNLRVSYNRDLAVTRLVADERRLKQMLVNLLSNAVKFTPEGGAVGLDVQSNSTRQEVHFTVWDTGPGIAPADQARLFQPFVQLDSDHAGTGLGLSLVARMASLHGGRVALESKGVPGEGSRFSIILPWRLPKSTGSLRGVPEGLSVPEALPANGPGAAPLILLADDNEINLSTLQRLLTALGYQVALARNGREVLAQAPALRPALILMDIQMPELNGLEATRALRASPDLVLASTPIIALTALAMPGDRERCLEAGAQDYLTKPVNLARLRQTIEAQLTAAPIPSARN